MHLKTSRDIFILAKIWANKLPPKNACFYLNYSKCKKKWHFLEDLYPVFTLTNDGVDVTFLK
jgi:hypothetical protein